MKKMLLIFMGFEDMSFPETGTEIPVLSYISALLESCESLLPTFMTLGTDLLGYVMAKESSPHQIRARQLWVPHGTLVLYILSLRKLSLDSYHAVFLDNFLPFCGNGTFFSSSQRQSSLCSLTHPQSTRPFFLRAPSLHVLQFTVYISSET